MKVKPEDHKKFWNIILIGFGLIILFTILDIYGSNMWSTTGNGNTYKTGGLMYQTLFWSFAYAFIIILGITYWIMRKDKSETLAVMLTPALLLQFGLEDVLFYLFKGINVLKDTMPWLTTSLWPPTIISRILGYDVIQGTHLVISAIIGIFIVIIIDKWLLSIDLKFIHTKRR
jgi:hypothetical protein